MDRPLSAHFTLAELCRTSTGLPNTPPDAVVVALQALCDRVLEPWREHVGPLRVTSGYRSPEVNDELRRRGYSASRTSQHLLGEAADVVPSLGLVRAWRELVHQVERGLPVDQAIVYVRAPGRGWVHVSHKPQGQVQRRELLVQTADGAYHSWESWGERALVLPSG